MKLLRDMVITIPVQQTVYFIQLSTPFSSVLPKKKKAKLILQHHLRCFYGMEIEYVVILAYFLEDFNIKRGLWVEETPFSLFQKV